MQMIPGVKHPVGRNGVLAGGMMPVAFRLCLCWHACTYRGHFKILWHVREGEEALNTLSWLLFLLEHVLLCSLGRLVVFTPFHLCPSS